MGLRLRRTLKVVLAGVVLAGIGATSAASSSTTTTTSPGSIVFAKGGKVTIAISHLPDELNPLTPGGSNQVTAMVMSQVWPQMFVAGDHLPPTLCPDGGTDCGSAVTSAEVVSTTPLAVTYTIDSRAKWSDGVPITSSDFIDEWHEELSVGATLPAANPLLGYQEIASISPPGAKTFTVRFSTPYSDWTSLFSPLVPAHVAAAAGWEGFRLGELAHVVSGGPYEISRVVPGRELTLSRNPAYWGPPARLSHLVFQVEPTVGATLRALRSGTVDVAVLPPGPELESLVATSDDLAAQTGPSPVLEQLLFNLADPTLTPAVREAVAESIDRHQLVEDTVDLSGADPGVVSNRLFLPDAEGAQANDGQYQVVDLDGADHLLAASGYHLDANGIVRSSSGAPLTLTLVGPSGDPLVSRVEAQLQAELLQAGIGLRVDNVAPKALLSQLLPAGDYQLALAPYLLSPYLTTAASLYTDPVGPSPSGPPSVAGSLLPTAGLRAADAEPASVVSGAVTRDVLGYEDPTVAGLFTEAAAELNETAGSGLYNQIDTALWAALPTLPLYEVPETVVTRLNLDGVTMSSSWAGPLWDAQNWAVQLSPTPTTTTTLGGG